MTKQTKIRIAALVLLLCAAVLFPVLVSGSGITESDPLISLSYLNGTYKTDVLQKAQQQTDAVATTLKQQLETHVGSLKANSGGASTDVTTHTAVTIPANSAYTVPDGAELLFLSGSAKTVAAGLTDMTAGEAVAADGALAENHLYVAASSVILQADSAAKILIRK